MKKRNVFRRELQELAEELAPVVADLNAFVLASTPAGPTTIAVHSIIGLTEVGKRVLAEEIIPAALVDFAARSAALLLPTTGADGVDYLCLLLVDDEGAEALLTSLTNLAWEAPTESVTGPFVASLQAALAAVAALPPCPDCGVAAGEPHRAHCDVERCSACNEQRLCCSCSGHDAFAARWRGEWPGVSECRQRGWYARRASVGWTPCTPGMPGARPDLNRLAFFDQMGYDGLYEPEYWTGSGHGGDRHCCDR